MTFANTYREYIRVARKTTDSGFNLRTMAKIEPVLAFLFDKWWKVNLQLKHLPKAGPMLIVGNSGGIFPWAGVMLAYGMMRCQDKPRRLYIMADLDRIEDERVYNFLKEIGFVSWSADNAKKLFAEGAAVVVFPEGPAGALKPFGERYRVRNFDWTKVMPAIEMGIPLVPIATIGPDESFPMGANAEAIAKFLDLPAFPITPFFPWLPFPLNLFSLPVTWKMHVMKTVDYKRVDAGDRAQLEETAKKAASYLEGDVQAELNRLLRVRVKSLF